MIAPFFPFSPDEQAVVAHKFVLQLQDDAVRPISITGFEKNYIGHSHVFLANDGKICQHVAKHGYVKELGARSVFNRVSDLRRKFVLDYSHIDDEIDEVFNDGPLSKYTIQLHPVSDTVEEISVFRDGVTTVAGKAGRK